MKHRIGAALAAASAAFALSGCATDDYGYGYGGVSMGYGSGYYGSPYYGDPYWGWYDNYYYPGTGYYIYDRSGARHRWSDSQRRYWEGRRGDRPSRENWSGYRRGGDGANRPRGAEAWRGQNRDRNQGLTEEQRQQRREAWQSRRQQSGQNLTDEQRQARREAWQSRRQQGQGMSDEQRQQRREAWQAQRQSQGAQGSSDRGSNARGPAWRGRERD